MVPTYPEKILLDALKEIKSLSATTLLDSGDTKINKLADDAIQAFEEEKARLNNIPPYA